MAERVTTTNDSGNCFSARSRSYRRQQRKQSFRLRYLLSSCSTLIVRFRVGQPEGSPTRNADLYVNCAGVFAMRIRFTRFLLLAVACLAAASSSPRPALSADQSAAEPGVVHAVLNRLTIDIDTRSGSILKLSLPGVGTILQSQPEKAGLSGHGVSACRLRALSPRLPILGRRKGRNIQGRRDDHLATPRRQPPLPFPRHGCGRRETHGRP